MKKYNFPFDFLDTPIVLIDMDNLEANIKEMSQLSSEVGVRLRPHTKAHECPFIAKLQINAGACGIEVGTVDRAECMIDAGIDDILIAHPFYGKQKLGILKKYFKKPNLNLTLVVDMFEQAKFIDKFGQKINKKIPVLLKIDLSSGDARFGVPFGAPALNLAKKITQQLSSIQLKGIYAHESGVEPTKEGVNKAAFESASLMSEMAQLLKKGGINIEHVSVGASPTFRATCHYLKENKFPEITEIHPGHCAIGDIWHTKNLGNKREACAATVLATVISTSNLDYFVIDAGYKTFGKDSLIAYKEEPGFYWRGKPSFGSIQGRTDLWLGSLSAETACIYYTDSNINSEKRLKLGERLEIVPNNSTLTINLQTQLYGVRNGILEKIISVKGRTTNSFRYKFIGLKSN